MRGACPERQAGACAGPRPDDFIDSTGLRTLITEHERSRTTGRKFFAHCEAESIAVKEGQSVSPGTMLCKLGSTGDATGPHLHFEMWVGGWQAKGGYPIDPLPYLEAWEGR